MTEKRPVENVSEVYSRERMAEFLLSNAIDDVDYAAASEEVTRLGVDPASIAQMELSKPPSSPRPPS